MAKRNMLFENVLIKMNQVPELTPEERIKYAKELDFINSQVDEIKKSLSTSENLSQQIENVHSECLSLHKSVDTFGDQYKKLDSALIKFQECIKDIDELTTETQHAWEKLTEVENKLKQKENPQTD